MLYLPVSMRGILEKFVTIYINFQMRKLFIMKKQIMETGVNTEYTIHGIRIPQEEPCWSPHHSYYTKIVEKTIHVTRILSQKNAKGNVASHPMKQV